MSELLRFADIARIVGVFYERARRLRHEPDFPARVGGEARPIYGRPRTFGAGLGPSTAATGVVDLGRICPLSAQREQVERPPKLSHQH
jgi:hypothetical protein